METIPIELNQESGDANLQDDDPDREPTTTNAPGSGISAKLLAEDDP